MKLFIIAYFPIVLKVKILHQKHSQLNRNTTEQNSEACCANLTQKSFFRSQVMRTALVVSQTNVKVCYELVSIRFYSFRLNQLE